MEIFTLSLNAVVPLFVVILLGYVAGKIGLIDDQSCNKLSIVAFRYVLPFNLFYNIYSGFDGITFDSGLMLLVLFIQVGSFIIAFFLCRLVGKDRNQRGSALLAIFRSNMLVFGLPIAKVLLPSDELATFTIALLIILPLQNIGSILGKEIYANAKGKLNWPEIIKNALTDPNMIGMYLGLIASILSIHLPACLESGIESISNMSSPFLLMLIGVGFDASYIVKNKRPVIISVVSRLIIVPLIFLIIISFVDLTTTERLITLLTCAAPTASTIYAFVEDGGLDKQLAKGTIVVSILCSMISLTLWVYVINSLAG
ncbi:MAG: AEC family transporter [Eubacteriales bacterium]|nr:AEC family transporter [Eubacteriales bacterium]